MLCSYATILLPSLLTAPRYFRGEVEFGVISQVLSLLLPKSVALLQPDGHHCWKKCRCSDFGKLSLNTQLNHPHGLWLPCMHSSRMQQAALSVSAGRGTSSCSRGMLRLDWGCWLPR